MLNLTTWVDAAYNVHDDMRSHTNSSMPFGTDVIMFKSTKQRLNTKSSTRLEVAGVNNYVPGVVWAEIFLKH